MADSKCLSLIGMRLINGRFFWPMITKRFYFIADHFFQDFPDPALMQNKEDGHGRPCFLAIMDDDGLFWMIPISSRVEKYKRIYERKTKTSRNATPCSLPKCLVRNEHFWFKICSQSSSAKLIKNIFNGLMAIQLWSAIRTQGHYCTNSKGFSHWFVTARALFFPTFFPLPVHCVAKPPKNRKRFLRFVLQERWGHGR